jgi:hypothetical protein
MNMLPKRHTGTGTVYCVRVVQSDNHNTGTWYLLMLYLYCTKTVVLLVPFVNSIAAERHVQLITIKL